MRRPSNLDSFRSELVKHGNTLTRIWYDSEGIEVWRASHTFRKRIGCPYDPNTQPREYHNWYYHNVRKHKKSISLKK
ncbi:hypothetical protein E4H04_11920 [Candidatus Bathyarchaeota archaeon]|nr:MAG: hypothetical protein E4H04_11920 [Candidatus Bathyarchaeota archaeon]